MSLNLEKNYKINAVVFDVDGTLYNQNKLRVYIAGLILKSIAKNPFKIYKDLKIVSEYRKNHEKLRLSPDTIKKFDKQVSLTAEKFNMDKDKAFETIYDWIHIKPLPYIKKTKRKDLNELIDWLKEKKIKTGLLSDYPCDMKAEILEIKDKVDLIKASTDDDIDVFKPETKGFLRMAELLNVKPQEMLYVGDRYKIDILGAINANVIPVLINKKKYKDIHNINSLSEIKQIINTING